MKNLARVLSLLILATVTVFFAACDKGDDSEPDVKAEQIEKLVGTWSASSVTYNTSTDYSTDYEDFKITIASSANNMMTYTVTGRPAETLSPWNTNGTFQFGTDPLKDLKRGDNVNLTYTVSGNTLVLTLSGYPSDKGYPTRVESVEGDWVFTLTKSN